MAILAGSVSITDKGPAGSAARLPRTERDLFATAIAFAAIILFIGTAGALAVRMFDEYSASESTNPLLASTVLLNIALIIFGWRHHVRLTTEIAERRQAELEALRLAELDPLTGCLNRRSIAQAAGALTRAAYSEDRSLAVMILDLDNFKAINDLNGHQTGDAVLVETTRRLQSTLPDDCILARLGGDEFAIVMRHDERRPQRAEQLALAIIERVSREMRLDDLALDITTSVGIAIALPDDAALEAKDLVATLMHRADIAMYHSKQAGRNRYSWFEPAMENELRFRGELETGIRRGIRDGEFLPFYEPQVDIRTGKLLGFEMLARWKSAQFGAVSPEIFVPIAEDIGAIAELSELLIRQALEDALQWDPALTLAVNISPLQLQDPWFSQRLLRMLTETGFPAARLEIEITESCLSENIGVVRAIIVSLKNQGVGVSLDDFGTGYSSLAQLRTLPFDRIKIDRSFVREIANDPNNRKIVEAVVSLSKGLGMPMTAEGIETEAVRDVLGKLGPFKAQGHLFGKPADAAATSRMLAREGLLVEAADAQEAEPTPPADQPREQAASA